MSKNALGLPYEYQKHPEYFDALCVCDDTEAKNSIIEKILRSYNVKTVLDMTCGTGSQVFYLEKQGYKVTGSDFSPALLEMARERASAEKKKITFIDGDMRTLKVGQFDAVITIFNAVGHLTKSGFEKTMRNIHKNLKPGGIYVFDILNLRAMTDTTVIDLSWHVHAKVHDTQIHTTQFSTIDRETGILTSHDHYMIQKNVEKPKAFKSKFSLQLYTAKELTAMLKKSGFEVLKQCDMNGLDFVNDKSLSILTVAQKTP